MLQSQTTGHTNTWKNTKKGFITVEAAIFLPIFIVGVLTFAYLIKFLSVQEGIFHSFVDEARTVSAEAAANPLSAPLFELKLIDRISDENGDLVSNVDVDHLYYLYPSHGMTGVISADLNYKVDIKLPIPLYDTLPVSESLVFRGFVGKEEALDPLPFEEMEKNNASDLVWIFPRAGGRYHCEDCTYIKSEPRQMILTNQIRRNYDPCKICDSADLPGGSLVYCFRTGNSYHAGDCPAVDKYVISVEKEDAVKRGYSPCSKCGGD